MRQYPAISRWEYLSLGAGLTAVLTMALVALLPLGRSDSGMLVAQQMMTPPPHTLPPPGISTLPQDRPQQTDVPRNPPPTNYALPVNAISTMPPSSAPHPAAGMQSSSAAMTGGASASDGQTYEEWRMQEFLETKAEYDKLGKPVPLDEIPSPSEVPSDRYDELMQYWSSAGIDVPADGPRAAAIVNTQYGCFDRNGAWTTQSANCAEDQLPYLQGLRSLPQLERSGAVDMLPRDLLNVVLPPPPITTPQQEQDALAIMRANYIPQEGQGERQAELAKLRETLTSAEQQLKTLSELELSSSTHTAVTNALQWIDVTKKTAAVSPLTVDEIEQAARELRRRLDAIESGIVQQLPEKTPAPEIHASIDRLMQLVNNVVPRVLSEANLALPREAGILILETNAMVDESKSSTCWQSEQLCPKTKEIVTNLATLMAAIDEVTVGHDDVRATLTRRSDELMYRR